MKVVPDTNIYISALLFKGQPLQLLEQATSRLVDLFVSHAILDESVSVIKRPKFRRTEGQVQEAVEIIRGLAQIAEPSRRVEAVKDDPADNRIIECAVAARADAIVSGDKHFLRAKELRGNCNYERPRLLESAAGTIRFRRSSEPSGLYMFPSRRSRPSERTLKEAPLLVLARFHPRPKGLQRAGSGCCWL